MTSETELHNLATMLEFGEARAYADVFQTAPEDLHMRVLSIAGAILFICPTLPVILFNRVIGLGFQPATEANLDQIIDVYREAGLSSFAVQLSPVAEPAEQLPTWLEARGLRRADNWPKVYRLDDPEPEPDTALSIREISQEHAAAFSGIARAAFDMPESLDECIQRSIGREGWRHYLAFAGDDPVACGALFSGDGIGWLGIAGTLPSHRRQGAQGALMARRINDGIRDGCQFLITETGDDLPDQPNPSFHNMLRSGFQLAYQRPNFIFTADQG